MILYGCPKCQAPMSSPDSMVGEPEICPECGNVTAVPAPEHANFVAIDFETATGKRNSACAIGCARVTNGRITDTFSSLIQPPGNEFIQQNISIHGITPDMTKDAPTFGDLWPEIERWICPGPIVAHNAAFDIGVMKDCLKASDGVCPDTMYFCTRRLAEKILPGLPNYRLTTLAVLFDISLDHHRAESDAVACAEIAIRLTNQAGPNDIDGMLRDIADFGKDTRVRGMSSAGVHMSKDEIKSYIENKYSPHSKQAAVPDERFDGKRFVFTGDLAFMTRSEAQKKVKLHGGKTLSGVSGKTDYVVVGYAIWDAYRKTGKTTGKLAKVIELQEAGRKIKIVEEHEFLKMINY